MAKLLIVVVPLVLILFLTRVVADLPSALLLLLPCHLIRMLLVVATAERELLAALVAVERVLLVVARCTVVHFLPSLAARAAVVAGMLVVVITVGFS